jgi:hypothetical protein
MAPVLDEMLGCQILVTNRILGGSKGYALGIWMSILKTPPSYGVPSGPMSVPSKWFVLSPTGLSHEPEHSAHSQRSRRIDHGSALGLTML